MEQEPNPEQVLKIVKDVLTRANEFMLSGEPAPGKHGLRVTLLKTGTLNQSLETTASVDRLRLILESDLMKARYKIAGWTQSKFELVVDIATEQQPTPVKPD